MVDVAECTEWKLCGGSGDVGAQSPCSECGGVGGVMNAALAGRGSLGLGVVFAFLLKDGDAFG